jgi:DNA polymerase delta subunit 1
MFIPWEYVEDKNGNTLLKNLQGSNTIKLNKIPTITDDAVLQFLTQHSISQVGWIHVKKYTKSSNKYICTVNDIENINRIDIPQLHVMSFDIEAYSKNYSFPDPFVVEDKIICISVVSNLWGRKTFHGNEQIMISDFFNYIKNTDIVIGYNTHGFDWKYICHRSDIKSFSKIPSLPSKWTTKQWSSSAYKNIDLLYLDIPGILILDLYHYCNRSYYISDYRLNTVAEHFGMGSKIDLEIHSMWGFYENNNLQPIIDYCEKDCELVIKLVDKINYIFDLFALSNVTHTHPMILFTQGQQVRVKNMLKYECMINGYWGNFKYGESSNYEGATVIDPIPGIYEHCACMDFASLYPSIIVSENICYSTYQESTKTFNKNIFGVIPNLVNKLIDERNKIRNDPSMKAYSNAIKISTNSIYGVFGSKGELNLIPAASMITKIGRESLNRAIEYLRQKNFLVVYGDTDSCIYTNRRKLTKEEHIQISNEVTSLFNKPIQMKYEAMYKKFLVLGKKMYITLTYDDSITYKGVIAARRDTCKFMTDFYKDIVSKIMRDEKFRDTIRYTIKNISYIPENQFYMRKTYNGPYKSETYPLEVYNKKYGPLNVGEIFYIKICQGTTVGDRMRPKQAIEPIDYYWYLKRLVNPIDSVMESSGKVFRLKYNIELMLKDESMEQV